MKIPRGDIDGGLIRCSNALPCRVDARPSCGVSRHRVGSIRSVSEGRDTLMQTGLKSHWSRRSAISCFNRIWRVTKSSAKHQSLLSPWVMKHQPWPSPSAWTKTRSLHGCRISLSLLVPSSLSFSLSTFLSLDLCPGV